MSEAVAVRGSSSAWSPAAVARLIALLLPLALLGGALGSQYFGGLHPCEMCIWQRWPHASAIVLAEEALATGPEQVLATGQAEAEQIALEAGIYRAVAAETVAVVTTLTMLTFVEPAKVLVSVGATGTKPSAP